MNNENFSHASLSVMCC